MIAIRAVVFIAVQYTTIMNTDEIISAIDSEIAKLHEARFLLSGYSDPTPSSVKKGPGRPKKTITTKPVKRVLSPEARARIAAGQKKRWAVRNKATK